MQLAAFWIRIFEGEKYWLLLKLDETQVSLIPGDSEGLLGSAQQDKIGECVG